MSKDMHMYWGYVDHPIKKQYGYVLGKGTVVYDGKEWYQGFTNRGEDSMYWYDLDTFECVRKISEEELEYMDNEEFLPF